MLSKSKLIPINELEAGMISASDIKFENNLLLAKGTPISESAIKILSENYIVDKVEILQDDDYKENLQIKAKTVEELENTFNELSSNLEDIFNNIHSLQVNGIDELRDFSKKIQEEFKSTGLVIRDIVSHGSTSENIYRHSVNVSAISYILAKWLGFTENEVNLLTYASILHDFGKTQIDQNIVNKKGVLTLEEKEILKTHPVIGYHFVKKIPFIDPSVGLGIVMHHERMDGSGYPMHIKREKIHKFAKIIAIADLFDNVSSNRYSQEIVGPFEALKIIQYESFQKLDNQYCNMFLNHIVNYYMGENVVLNDERECKIIQVDINDITKPLLLDDNGFLDLRKEKDLYITKLVV